MAVSYLNIIFISQVEVTLTEIERGYAFVTESSNVSHGYSGSNLEKQVLGTEML